MGINYQPVTGESWILTDINSMSTKCQFNLVQKRSLSSLTSYLYRTNEIMKGNADVFQGKYLASIHVSPGDFIPIRPINGTPQALLHCCNVCQLQAKGYTSHIHFYLSCRWKLILLDTYLWALYLDITAEVMYFTLQILSYKIMKGIYCIYLCMYVVCMMLW